MNGRNRKRLVLNKETVRNLQDHRLSQVVGGAGDGTDPTCKDTSTHSCLGTCGCYTAGGRAPEGSHGCEYHQAYAACAVKE